MGAWIEIDEGYDLPPLEVVAPFVGAWIEIHEEKIQFALACAVAPFVGAWIEITIMHGNMTALSRSLPSWERGLKSDA